MFSTVFVCFHPFQLFQLFSTVFCYFNCFQALSSIDHFHPVATILIRFHPFSTVYNRFRNFCIFSGTFAYVKYREYRSTKSMESTASKESTETTETTGIIETVYITGTVFNLLKPFSTIFIRFQSLSIVIWLIIIRNG